jgi:hypothetical protein
MTTRSSRCKACGTRTTASAGYCQSCKSKRHHGYKRLKEENLLLDEAGGAWWIWDRRGDVIVSGKPTRDAAIIALGVGEDDVEDVEDDVLASGEHHATKKTAVQLDREINAVLAGRMSTATDDAGVFYLTDTKEQPLGPEFRSRLAAKRAALKLVRAGSHPRVEVWHRWRGDRYMQGLANEDGWSDV